MNILVTVILMILNIGNVCLHGIGIYLLFCLHRLGKSNTQNIYIGNLSASELLMNLLEILRHTFVLCQHYGQDKSHLMDSIVIYISMVMFMGISLVFYLDMIYITLDRLLNIILNLRYRVYWSNKRAKLLLQGTWLISFLLTVSVAIAYRFCNFKSWESMLYKYVYPTMEFAFIILAFITYVFIFKKYKSSEAVLTKRKMSVQQNKKPDNAFRIFRKSRFFVPVLLIFTFILFMLIPDMIILFMTMLHEDDVSPELLASCWISYALSNIVDGYIYIFMQTPVRKLFFKKAEQLCCKKTQRQQPESPIIASKPRNLSQRSFDITAPRLRIPSRFRILALKSLSRSSQRSPSSQSTLLSCSSPPLSPGPRGSSSSYSRHLLASLSTPVKERRHQRHVGFSVASDSSRLLDKCAVGGDDDVFHETSDKVFVPESNYVHPPSTKSKSIVRKI